MKHRLRPGQPPGLQRGQRGGEHRLVPAGDLDEMAKPTLRRRLWVTRSAQIAQVLHRKAQALQGARYAGDAQRIGPHAGAQHAGADVGGCAYQGQLGHG